MSAVVIKYTSGQPLYCSSTSGRVTEVLAKNDANPFQKHEGLVACSYTLALQYDVQLSIYSLAVITTTQ